jgi:hypothetical protein
VPVDRLPVGLGRRRREGRPGRRKVDPVQVEQALEALGQHPGVLDAFQVRREGRLRRELPLVRGGRRAPAAATGAE